MNVISQAAYRSGSIDCCWNQVQQLDDILSQNNRISPVTRTAAIWVLL